MKTSIRSTIVLAAVGVSVAGLAAAGTTTASEHTVEQTVPVVWHPQSGKAGAVAAGAEATLWRTERAIRYRFDTSQLTPGHVYTVWFAVINDPAQCSAVPCPPPEFVTQPQHDAQVVWGRDGEIAPADGSTRFKAKIKAGPLLDGWLQVQGLDDPMGAAVHLVINDHGPVIPDLLDEMLSTYRAGCSDDSKFPAFFPATALADGTPGPNTCILTQMAIFEPPA